MTDLIEKVAEALCNLNGCDCKGCENVDVFMPEAKLAIQEGE